MTTRPVRMHFQTIMACNLLSRITYIAILLDELLSQIIVIRSAMELVSRRGASIREQENFYRSLRLVCRRWHCVPFPCGLGSSLTYTPVILSGRAHCRLLWLQRSGQLPRMSISLQRQSLHPIPFGMNPPRAFWTFYGHHSPLENCPFLPGKQRCLLMWPRKAILGKRNHNYWTL
jgi:hypothetical protein